ncbi:3-carboxy-cis,cis-muconate cycloisomerase [Rivibacter subsaxonicus]|uniref:3-carboxy-cis,cis-muconate cycloisomerase n=1 Tax=Rivibacter subsaxonicus TaxID=457575 RepID=A0A4Q7VVN7_9BURK|nr:3-carboxy-cis,cis-muconate cycloisomerase [Rivibacter subsaxonicus]RZU00721.1 3-carboxy-cis,cis-muconate cycloisomerase [Rivibacter subsaxonicus]
MTLPALDRFLSTPEIAAAFSDVALLQAMFDFEAALARAQAAEGLIPASAATAIAGVCKVELFDAEAIIGASGRAGSLAIPLVDQLRRSVALFDPEAARHVHHGSTSQDAIDSALALCTKRALVPVGRDLAGLIDALLALAETHVDTPLLARTLMQPALPTSFGLKCANWAAPLVRSRARLHELARGSLALQLGGAVGTLAVMGPRAGAVAQRMAADLGLALPPAPWHTQRDEWLRLGLEVAVLTGSLGKIGADLALMSQAEVAELAEPSAPGRGGSSAMPHKRNPVAAMTALAAAQRAPARAAALLGAMGQAHERGLGDWQAEIAEWPALWTSAHGALAALLEAMRGLQVDPVRMLRNLAEHGPLEEPPPPAHLQAAATLARRRVAELRAQNSAIDLSLAATNES